MTSLAWNTSDTYCFRLKAEIRHREQKYGSKMTEATQNCPLKRKKAPFYAKTRNIQPENIVHISNTPFIPFSQCIFLSSKHGFLSHCLNTPGPKEPVVHFFPVVFIEKVYLLPSGGWQKLPKSKIGLFFVCTYHLWSHHLWV